MERILGRNNLLSIFVPLMGAIVTAIIGVLFFRPQELWNYNLVSRFEGIGFLFVAPFIFFMGCYLAALVPYWISREEKTFIPLLLATSACLGVFVGQILSTFIEVYTRQSFLRLIVSAIICICAVRLSLIKTRVASRGYFRRFVRPGLIVILLFVPVIFSISRQRQSFPHQASFSVRDQWAKENLDPYYSAAVNHVKGMKTIRQDIGNIIVVAPSPHSPNGMYDGGNTFTLDVEGEKGSGRCKVGFLYWGGDKGEIELQSANWSFNNKSVDLMKIKEDELHNLPLEQGASEYPDVSLIEAIRMKNNKLIAYLVEKGADVNQEKNGDAPLVIAIRYRSDYDTIRYLLDHKAKVTSAVVMSAASMGGYRKEIMKLLLDSGADVNMVLSVVYSTRFKNTNQDVELTNITPLSLAVLEDNVDLVRLLLEHGADVNKLCEVRERSLLSSKSYTISPLEMAKKNGYGDIEKILLEVDNVKGASSRQ